MPAPSFVSNVRVSPDEKLEDLERDLNSNRSATLYWVKLAKYYEENKDSSAALQTYQDGVKKCPHFDLWAHYLNFVKSRVGATVKQVLEVLEEGFNSGMYNDYRAGPFFLEYVALLKKIMIYQARNAHELELEDVDGDSDDQVVGGFANTDGKFGIRRCLVDCFVSLRLRLKRVF